MRRSFRLAIFVLLAISTSVFSQIADDWPLEHLHTRSGQSPAGLLLSQRDDTYEFAEIMRPPGKPVYAVIRSVPAAQVLLYQPLDAPERAVLAERYVAIRHRALIEAMRMEGLRLRSLKENDTTYLVYEGPWFSLRSTAEDATTRRAIVRLEQTFCAYRQLLPPRGSEAKSFRIFLYGSSREYHAAQQERGWTIPHPAFYAPQSNMVMAGTDFSDFEQDLSRAAAQNATTRQQWKDATASFEERLARDALVMKQNGFATDEVETQIRLMRGTWQDEQKRLEKQLADAEQHNQLRFREATARIYRRLQHEAFHAYLENYVYPHDRFHVPRWLNEGLAQVFENAQLDADTLRVDAPPPHLLARWKQDLKTGPPLPLRELLTGDEPLPAGHEHSDRASRHYLHAWSLAFYLVFLQEKLATPAFERYVAREPIDPVAKFERLAGTDIDTFETRWHAAMAKLK